MAEQQYVAREHGRCLVVFLSMRMKRESCAALFSVHHEIISDFCIYIPTHYSYGTSGKIKDTEKEYIVTFNS